MSWTVLISSYPCTLEQAVQLANEPCRVVGGGGAPRSLQPVTDSKAGNEVV